MRYCLRLLKRTRIRSKLSYTQHTFISQCHSLKTNFYSLYTQNYLEFSSLIRNAHTPTISLPEKPLHMSNTYRLQYNTRIAINHSLLAFLYIIISVRSSCAKKNIKQKSRKFLCEKISPANRHIFNYSAVLVVTPSTYDAENIKKK